MSVRRCPNCGGLVSADVKWCGQCYARLDEDEVETTVADTAPETTAGGEAAAVPEGTGPEGSLPTAPQAGAAPPRPRVSPSGMAGTTGVRVAEGGRVVWDCPACDQENEIEARVCSRCGTAFGRLWEEPEPPPRVSPERAVLLSLLIPGAGQVAAGRVADGIARGVVFAFALAMVVAILVAGGSLGGPLVSLVVLFAGASLTLYLATAVDAHRAARREPPVLSTRVLLIGATVLLVVAVVVLLIGGSGTI